VDKYSVKRATVTEGSDEEARPRAKGRRDDETGDDDGSGGEAGSDDPGADVPGADDIDA
jgi:hypothetical protein